MGLQTKRKREHESIQDVMGRMGPAVEERREAIRKELLSESLDEMLANSGSTIRARIMDLYEEGQRQMCLVLQEALSSIHIAGDGWTAPNALGIFGIVGHFTNEEGTLQALLLALVEVKGAHTGEQIATQMFQAR